MKKLFYYILPMVALCALVSCSEDTTGTTSTDVQQGKTPIAFSADGNIVTRGGVITRTGFTKETKVVVRIKAEVNGTTLKPRYTHTSLKAKVETTADDEHNTAWGLTGTHSDLEYISTTQERYWDDAYGRDSKLTVYAVAVPNKNDDTILPDKILNQAGEHAETLDWYSVDSESDLVSWKVSAQQSADTRGKEDLAYSNNIKEGETTYKGRYHQEYKNGAWEKSMQLGRLAWQSQDPNNTSVTVGMFDRGHLVFKHALTWITLVLTEGAGFKNTDNTDFTWTKENTSVTQNITLTGFPTSGKQDVSTGVWSSDDLVTNVDITQMDESVDAVGKTVRTLHAYVLPGTILKDVETNVIAFEIDNAKYYVKGKQIADAIRSNTTKGDANFTKTEIGKHYTINLTIGKTGISDMTAAILDWEDVNSDEIKPSNATASFIFEDRATKLGSGAEGRFDIYRAGVNAGDGSWLTGYETTAANKSYSTDHWTTDWYWPDNNTYYHFRAIGPRTSGTAPLTFTPVSGGSDYFTINSGAIADGAANDYVWGAPFTHVDDAYKIKYDNTNGFGNTVGETTTKQLSPAINATTSQIKMLLFHMMSKINVTVKTTTDAGKVKLQDGSKNTKVEILNFLQEGKVLMGTGAVSTISTSRTASVSMTEGTYTAESGTTPASYSFSYGIVPQALSWTTDPAGTIGLRITTPDGNVYTISDLSKYAGTVGETNLKNPYTETSTGSGKYTINAWYPHYQYTYNVTITKTGIANITAAALPWEEVVTDLGTINLENN